MKKKVLPVVLIIFVTVLVNSMNAGVFAETIDSENNFEITPYYTAIVLCYNNLELNSGGKLSCEGITSVQMEYTAGVKMELQQLSDDWTTIKTWEGASDDEEIYL